MAPRGETSASPSNLDAYESLEVIGSGTFGIIRKVRRTSDGKLFARKELNFERMSDRDRKQIVSEVNILRTLTHHNIVRYEERFVDRDNGILYIVMEYCQGGDLGSTIKECRKTKRLLPEDTVVSYLSQMIQGLDACHNAPAGTSRVILHRDLKPENIFLDGEQTIKIGDFGLSKEVAAHTFCSTYVGTPYYMSPELAVGAHYDVKSDIWALGCVAYELCGLRPPFDATTQGELTRKIQQGHVPELPRGYSRVLGDMIRSMLCLDPSKRPTTRSLLQHPIIRLAVRRREDHQRQARPAPSRRETALNEREAGLNKRQEELDEREAGLKEREERLARSEDEVRSLMLEVQMRQFSLEQREQSVNQAAVVVAPAVAPPPAAPIAVPSTMASAASFSSVHRDRPSRREFASTENNIAAAGLRRLAARRGSAQRMQSSPCVVMGPSALDNSDISMRDASSWMANSDEKENKVSTPLRGRRSSPAKVSYRSSSRSSINAARPMAPAPFGAAEDDSLPSPFLRKILRTQSQPHASPADGEQLDGQKGTSNKAVSCDGAQVAEQQQQQQQQHNTRGHPAQSMVRTAVEGAAREAFRAAAVTAVASAAHSKADDLAAARHSRRMSALPRRRQSVLPGSIGVAPLGRKSGEAIRA